MSRKRKIEEIGKEYVVVKNENIPTQFYGNLTNSIDNNEHKYRAEIRDFFSRINKKNITSIKIIFYDEQHKSMESSIKLNDKATRKRLHSSLAIFNDKTRREVWKHLVRCSINNNDMNFLMILLKLEDCYERSDIQTLFTKKMYEEHRPFFDVAYSYAETKDEMQE